MRCCWWCQRLLVEFYSVLLAVCVPAGVAAALELLKSSCSTLFVLTCENVVLSMLGIGVPTPYERQTLKESYTSHLDSSTTPHNVQHSFMALLHQPPAFSVEACNGVLVGLAVCHVDLTATLWGQESLKASSAMPQQTCMPQVG